MIALAPRIEQAASSEMPAVAVDVQHAAVVATEDPLDRLATPTLEVSHRGHVVRVDALGHDPAGHPTDHVAARPAVHERHAAEEVVLHRRVQREREVDRLANHLGLGFETHVRLGRPDQLEGEIQGVDQDEMADAEVALGPSDEKIELPA